MNHPDVGSASTRSSLRSRTRPGCVATAEASLPMARRGSASRETRLDAALARLMSERGPGEPAHEHEQRQEEDPAQREEGAHAGSAWKLKVTTPARPIVARAG